MMLPGNSKGGGAINTIATMRDLMGVEQFTQMVSTLPSETRAMINRRILAVEWLPIANITPLTEKFYETWCGGDDAKLIEQARLSCRRDFNTMYRFFLRVLSPAYVLQRTAQIWHVYSDVGDLAIVSHVKSNGRESLRLHMDGYYPCTLYAITTQAYIHEILALAQAKDLAVERRNVSIENQRLSCDYEISFAA